MLDNAMRPGAIGPLAVPHRVIMGSMHLGLETDGDGETMAAFYAERARGGAALIVTGGCAVSPEGAAGASYGLAGDERHGARLARTAVAVHEAGGLVALQLFHAGRYATMDAARTEALAPSALPSRFSAIPPREMDEAQIEQTIGDFARAATRARELGYDAVEVMASEGYLINQFCSPLTNRRRDGWGGDAPRRRRFALAVLARIREAVGEDFPIIVRMSGADLMEGSSTAAEVADLARALAAGSADALNVGVGWHESRVPTVQALVPSGTWIPVARTIKDAVGDLPVIAGNRINRIEHADRILAAGACDFVSMARPFLADPELVAKARRGSAAAINLCIACNQACIDRSLVDERVSCMVNPRAGRELEAERRPDGGPSTGAGGVQLGRGGRIAVVGGGPAGLQAASELAALGHRVELFEATDELGGQFRLARAIPGKEDFGETIRSFSVRLAELDVEVRLSESLDGASAERLGEYDGVILATGVVPRQVSIPGAELAHVRTYVQAIERVAELGSRVVVVGAGGIGVDVAHLLSAPAGEGQDPQAFRAAHGLALDPLESTSRSARTRRGTHGPVREVTLLCRGGRIGSGIGATTRWVMLDALRRAGVRQLTGVVYKRIRPDGVELLDREGKITLIPADTVVLATGQDPHDPLSQRLSGLGVPHRVVGGARGSEGLDAVRAFAEGHHAARELSRVVGRLDTTRAAASRG